MDVNLALKQLELMRAQSSPFCGEYTVLDDENEISIEDRINIVRKSQREVRYLKNKSRDRVHDLFRAFAEPGVEFSGLESENDRFSLLEATKQMVQDKTHRIKRHLYSEWAEQMAKLDNVRKNAVKR